MILFIQIKNKMIFVPVFDDSDGKYMYTLSIYSCLIVITIITCPDFAAQAVLNLRYVQFSQSFNFVKLRLV